MNTTMAKNAGPSEHKHALVLTISMLATGSARKIKALIERSAYIKAIGVEKLANLEDVFEAMRSAAPHCRVFNDNLLDVMHQRLHGLDATIKWNGQMALISWSTDRSEMPDIEFVLEAHPDIELVSEAYPDVQFEVDVRGDDTTIAYRVKAGRLVGSPISIEGPVEGGQPAVMRGAGSDGGSAADWLQDAQWSLTLARAGTDRYDRSDHVALMLKLDLAAVRELAARHDGLDIRLRSPLQGERHLFPSDRKDGSR